MSSRSNQLKQTLVEITHSIRFKLVLWFVLILGVVMAGFSGFLYWRQLQDTRSIAVARLNIVLEHLEGSQGESDHGLEPIVPGSPGILSQNLATNSDVFASEVVALQDTNGTVLDSNGVLTNDQIQQLNLPFIGWSGVQEVRVPKISQVEDNRYLFINPAIQQNGRIRGYLLVGVPLDANNQLGKLVISLILGNLITLVIALTGGFWLADRAMRPVRTITQTAREISESDLHKRLHLPGNDELSELGNTFDKMLDRLQAAFERQRQFTADASHELRTPLTIINLESERGLSAKRTVDEYEKILRTIKSENRFMIRLATNLLALARMEAGQLSLKAEMLDLSELATEVIERLAPLANAQGVSINVGEMPALIVMGDRSTLLQMLTNLVENAIKYSAGVKHPQVMISAGQREEGKHSLAWVRISDNGIGIAPENQAHIFDRFYQVDKARTRLEKSEEKANEPESSGTGLGLAIAHWIVQAHQGEIQVQSALGQGSTFEVLLPTPTPTN
jgi:signal transduction histidine kinase